MSLSASAEKRPKFGIPLGIAANPKNATVSSGKNHTIQLALTIASLGGAYKQQ